MSNLPTSAPRCDVAIVGGGCAGTLVASQLLRRASGPFRIVLFERSSTVGRGVAYGTDLNEHQLNVCAARMSALPDEPDHFLNWARKRTNHLGFPETVEPGDYLPRWMFGRYLASVLEESQALAARGAECEVVAAEVVDLVETPGGGKTLTLADGREFTAQSVVLALGLLPGEYPIRRPLPIYHSPRYLHSPLLPTALSGVEKYDDILVVGAGLTAVDIIVQCRVLGHRGMVHALSRRGLQPLVHGPLTAPYPPFLHRDALPRTIREAVRRIRAEVRDAARRGIDWRPVLDSIRPVSAAIWEGFSWAERARFLRHVRPFWEVHRHRITPHTAAIVAGLKQEGRLRFHAGRLTTLREINGAVAAVIQVRGTQAFEALQVKKVINCTGPRTDYSKYQHPLLVNLLAAGLIGHDPLALGIDALPSGQVLRYGFGNPVAGLFTIGAALKGVLWESTAVPEIRQQAAQLARLIVRELPAQS